MSVCVCACVRACARATLSLSLSLSLSRSLSLHPLSPFPLSLSLSSSPLSLPPLSLSLFTPSLPPPPPPLSLSLSVSHRHPLTRSFTHSFTIAQSVQFQMGDKELLLCFSMATRQCTNPPGMASARHWSFLSSTTPTSSKSTTYVRPGAGIIEADDRHVTTVFTVQSSFHHRHSKNRVSLSVTVVGERQGEVRLHVHRRW